MPTDSGHDHDCDQATECACGEVVRDPAAHQCKPIGWSEPVYIPADDQETP